MSRLPNIFLLLFVFFLLLPRSVFALGKFGPHIVDQSSPQFLENLRLMYTNAGVSDWVPVTVLFTPGTNAESFLKLFLANKFLPILRIYNSGNALTTDQVDSLVNSFKTADSVSMEIKTESRGYQPIIVFGNEVNDGKEWSGTPDAPTYFSLLQNFVSQIHSANLHFTIANAPLNSPLPNEPPTRMGSVEFWKNGVEMANQLDILAFNSYSEGSWNTEITGAHLPDKKPIILTEFGSNPLSNSSKQRKDYISKAFNDYKNGQFPTDSRIVAITPLLYYDEENIDQNPAGSYEIPIFGSDGSVLWKTPDQVKNNSGNTNPPQGSDGNKNGTKSFFDDIGNDLTNSRKQQLFLVDPSMVSTKSADQKGPVQASNEYTLIGGVHTPFDDTQPVSTNLIDSFKDAVGNLLDFLGIQKKGDENATKWANASMPQDVNPVAYFQDKEQLQMLAEDPDSRVLAGQTEKSAMANVLPFLQCASLPLGVKGCEKVNGSDSSSQLTDTNNQTTNDTSNPTTPNSFRFNYPLTVSEISQSDLANFDANREKIITAVEKRWPDSPIRNNWDAVVSTLTNVGVNPAFGMAIWIEETGASAVCTLADQKYGRSDASYNLYLNYGIWDFGITNLDRTRCGDSLDVKSEKLAKQLESFASRKSTYRTLYNNSHDPDLSEIDSRIFLWYYSEGHVCDNPDNSCPINNTGFFTRLPLVYDCLVSSSPNRSSCPAGYFAF